jgi:hypothetical protein
MSVTLPAFTPIEETLFLTLCGRALDNRLPHPILADPMAGQLVRALGYDCNRFHLSPSYTRFAIWAANHYHGTQSVAGLIKSPGFDDPREPERWNPRLQLVREILLMRELEVAEFPRGLPVHPPSGTARPGLGEGPRSCTTASNRCVRS